MTDKCLVNTTMCVVVKEEPNAPRMYGDKTLSWGPLEKAAHFSDKHKAWAFLVHVYGDKPVPPSIRVVRKKVL